MKRLLVALLLFLALSPVLAISPAPEAGLVTIEQALAEAGCTSYSLGAHFVGGAAPYSYGDSQYSCSASDPGSRTLQTCIVINGTWWDCDTAYPTGTSGLVRAECHAINTGTFYSAYAWYYFRGEDGSEYSGYGNQAWVPNCNYGID